MKKNKYIISILLFLLATDSLLAVKKWTYEIEGAGTGVQTTYLVKVTVVSKKPAVDDETFVECAVHGVLFRGFESKDYRQKQRPMVGNLMVEQDNKEYFDAFFDGNLTQFAQIVDGSRQIRKKEKRYYITATIQVFKEELRHKLENDGIVKRINDGFE